jgi:hypothetical protein
LHSVSNPSSSIPGIKKRKRAKDQVEQRILSTTNQATPEYFYTRYWNSGLAKKVFVPLVGKSVTDCLARRIDSLRHSNSLEAAWVGVVNMHDKDGLCKPAPALFKIRQQCQLLCQAYIFALARMNSQSEYDVPNKTWRDCCEAACESLNPCGNVAATTGRTIERWNMEFRKNNKYVHPNPIVRSGKCPEPSLFEHFPETKDAIKRFTNGNLADLTTELLQDFIVTNLHPGSLKSQDERKELLDFYKENRQRYQQFGIGCVDLDKKILLQEKVILC